MGQAPRANPATASSTRSLGGRRRGLFVGILDELTAPASRHFRSGDRYTRPRQGTRLASRWVNVQYDLSIYPTAQQSCHGVGDSLPPTPPIDLGVEPTCGQESDEERKILAHPIPHNERFDSGISAAQSRLLEIDQRWLQGCHADVDRATARLEKCEGSGGHLAAHVVERAVHWARDIIETDDDLGRAKRFETGSALWTAHARDDVGT